MELLAHEENQPNILKIKRLAVAIFFFVNGFCYANWVARMPEVKDIYNVSYGTLSTLLLFTAAGSLTAMPFAGIVSAMFGSRRITGVLGILFCLIIPLIPQFSNLWAIRFMFYMIGVIAGGLDVAMNGQAVFVERLWKRPIMSSFHAVFSVGTALGAGSGALFTKYHIPLTTHLAIIALFGLVLNAWAATNLVHDTPQKAQNADTSRENKEGSNVGLRLPTAAILPLGLIAFCGMTGEGSMADWSAMYMNKIVGKDLSFSALAFGSFTSAMTIGRFFGDDLLEKIGKRKLLIYNSLASIFGLSLSLIFLNPYIVLLGFFITGLGGATIVPIVYSSAGNTEGVPPSVGIAMATTVGYAGFFVGPPVIGFIADLFNLRVGLLFSLFLFCVMLGLVLKKIK
jgi:MFS family permease